MTRAVLDTNVWISGYLWRGAPRQLLELAQARRFAPIVSHAILHELGVTLVAKLGVPTERCIEIQRGVVGLSELVVVPSIIPYPVRDPKDLPVIACAVAARADALVTGDHDLLTLKAIRGIPVLTIRQFLNTLAV